MQTITLQVENDSALKAIKDLEARHLISIVENTESDSPALPGNCLSSAEFRNWINNAEQGNTLSLNDVKEKWAGKKRQLQSLLG